MTNKRPLRLGLFEIAKWPARLDMLVCLVGIGMSLVATAQYAPGGTPRIEDRLGGIRVGDRLRVIRRVYPGLYQTLPDEGWSLAIGRNCILRVATSEHGGEDALSEAITLERINLADKSRDQLCDDVRTGGGLRFGDDIREVKRIYKDIALVASEPQYSLYRIDNGTDCLSGRSAVFRAMFVFWSEQDHRIVRIIISNNTGDCNDYKHSFEKEPQ